MSVFIVAEAGVNHLGDRAKMLALCDAAKAAGADAVKFQAYNTAKLIERRSKGDRDLLAKCELTDEDLDAIAGHCNMIGLKWFASVFDPSQVGRVLSRGACALKIGHAESDWLELRVACHRRNVECWHSHRESYWSTDIGAVWCIPEYPAVSPPHLKVVGGKGFQGFSSHYTDYRIPAAAALRGAEYIEAHLMLGERTHHAWVDARTMIVTEALPDTYTTEEPERGWSLDRHDFASMVKLIREYEGWL